MPVFPHHSSPSSSRLTLASNNPVHPHPNMYQPPMVPHVSFPCRLVATLPMLCLFCTPGPLSLFFLIFLFLDAPFMRYASDLARKADIMGRFGRKDKPLARAASNLVAVLYTTPNINRRGPSPIMLFPAFKTGYHLFGSDYNLADKSEVAASNDWDCSNKCQCYAMDLIQFIDVKIAGYQHTHPGHAKIFGFIAARDNIKPLRNYVYMRNIDNCEVVSVKRKTGVARLSLNSPARVISMPSRALIEFELHTLSEGKTDGDDDLIIEGCTELYNMTQSESFIQNQRLYGQRCALDIKYLVLINAMEARVDIEVIRVPAHGINLKLLAKTSGFSNVIQLFRGTVMEVGFTASFAVAVEKRNYLDLYIEGSQRDDLKIRQSQWWQCSFGSRYHWVEDVMVELGDFAAVSVKISWKSYEKKL